MPGWASLPNVFVGGALLVAVIGMYWDISLHIDNGRDPGPLANPAHYLILFGLFGIFIAGLLSMALPEPGTKPSATAVRLQHDWYAPLGAVLMTACAGFALAGFPLDDVWHRLFGQDVTLWGPTHLMLIGGASLATLAAAMLIAEGARAATKCGREPNKSMPVAAPRDARRRVPGRPLDRAGRVRLLRAAVPAALPPGAADAGRRRSRSSRRGSGSAAAAR